MSPSPAGRELVVVQPLIAPYRVPVLQYLAQQAGWRITVVAGAAPAAAGFAAVDLRLAGVAEVRLSEPRSLFGGRLLWQGGSLRQALRRRPAVYWLCGNPRDLSLWLTLLLLALRRRTVYTHGQGAYAHPQGGRWYGWAWRLMIGLSSAYIAYTEDCAASLRRLGVPAGRLRIAENSLQLTCTRRPDQRDYSRPGVLFIGRLREDSGLDLLVQALLRVRAGRCPAATLDVIGDGAQAASLRQRHAHLPWIRWHGAVYDDERIARLAEGCMVGCYPGDAGLSVVQFMGLSLVPVVHDQLHRHMGPEPGYVKDGINGRLFERAAGAPSLARCLEDTLAQPQTAAALGAAAWRTYRELTEPALGERLARIFGAAGPTP